VFNGSGLRQPLIEINSIKAARRPNGGKGRRYSLDQIAVSSRPRKGNPVMVEKKKRDGNP